MLEAKNISFKIGNKYLVNEFSYHFLPGKCYMLCGPNGAGKSTLLKLLSLDLTPTEGQVFYNNELTHKKNKAEYATYRSVLSQNLEISFPLTVEELVMMGRYPHFDARPTKTDFEICEKAMETLTITTFRKRNYLTLSGGEKQRVQFARVLVQIWEPPKNGCRILLLDEPISSLDIKYQIDFLNQLKKLMNDKTIVVAILHDLNLVLNYSDEVLLLNHGKLFANGNPEQVLSPQNIKTVFEVDSEMHRIGSANFIWVK